MHGFIKVANVLAIEKIIKPFIVADYSTNINLFALFHRANTATNHIIKITKEEIEQINMILATNYYLADSKSNTFHLMCLLANKYQQITKEKPGGYYIYFDETLEKIRAIKAFRNLVTVSEFKEKYGTIQTGLRFAKYMVEEHFYFGPVSKEFVDAVIRVCNEVGGIKPVYAENKAITTGRISFEMAYERNKEIV